MAMYHGFASWPCIMAMYRESVELVAGLFCGGGVLAILRLRLGIATGGGNPPPGRVGG